MPDQTNQPENQPQQESIFLDDLEVPTEAGEQSEPEHPRRAASAEFIVESQVGSVGVLREAMDPANQSLTEALHLSYRVLQIVIVILVALFLVSGFKRIENSQTGVQTLFGTIQGKDDGIAELQPGLAMSWFPYPAAEFIVFNQNYAIDMKDAFWPNAQLAKHTTFEDGAKSVKSHDPFNPGLGAGRDGMVLLVDGLGHVQLAASYRIEDPVDFVEHVQNERHGEQIVRLALQHATIQVTSRMTLDEMIEQAEVVADRVQSTAQQMLDDLDIGIDIQRVQAINLRPPVAIYIATTQLGEARSQAKSTRADARSDRTRMLAAAAGEASAELLDLIDQFQTSLIGQGAEHPETQSLLRQVDELITGDRMGGAVAETISRAEAYQEGIVSTFESYAERFRSLYPQYQANPDFIIRTQIYDAYGRIMGGELVELIMMPGNVGAMNIKGTSSSEIMLTRRRASQERRRTEAREAVGLTGFRHSLGQFDIKFRLGIDEQGNIVGRQGQDN